MDVLQTLFDPGYNPWVTPGPAGTAIADRMHFQASLTAAAAGNVENAVSLSNARDAWAQVASNALGRMGALSVGAADGLMSTQDRLAMQGEFGSLQKTISGITSYANPMAQYNGFALLGGGLVDTYA